MIVIWLCGVGVPQVATASVAQTGSNPALVAYLDGLDALTQGHWIDAVSAVSRALENAGDEPGIVLARGVANTLAEQFPQALKDLERAKRLGLKGREATLWTYAAVDEGMR
jgi:Flp pilus assembly protein TadD